MKTNFRMMSILGLGALITASVAVADEPQKCSLRAQYRIEKVSRFGKVRKIRSDTVQFCSTDDVASLGDPGETFLAFAKKGVYLTCGRNAVANGPLLQAAFAATAEDKLHVQLYVGKDDPGVSTQIRIRKTSQDPIRDAKKIAEQTVDDASVGIILEGEMNVELPDPAHKRQKVVFEKAILVCE